MLSRSIGETPASRVRHSTEQQTPGELTLRQPSVGPTAYHCDNDHRVYNVTVADNDVLAFDGPACRFRLRFVPRLERRQTAEQGNDPSMLGSAMQC